MTFKREIAYTIYFYPFLKNMKKKLLSPFLNIALGFIATKRKGIWHRRGDKKQPTY